jgi:hypothetical protein
MWGARQVGEGGEGGALRAQCFGARGGPPSPLETMRDKYGVRDAACPISTG